MKNEEWKLLHILLFMKSISKIRKFFHETENAKEFVSFFGRDNISMKYPSILLIFSMKLNSRIDILSFVSLYKCKIIDKIKSMRDEKEHARGKSTSAILISSRLKYFNSHSTQSTKQIYARISKSRWKLFEKKDNNENSMYISY